MKSQDLAKLRQLDQTGLTAEREKLKTDLAKITHELKIGKSTNTKAPSAIRHQIAVINTIISELNSSSTK